LAGFEPGIFGSVGGRDDQSFHRTFACFPVHVLVPVPAQRRAGETRPPAVPRISASPPGPVARLPGVFVRLPLRVLRRHPAQLHPGVYPTKNYKY
jgi:hypothetical protein